MTSILYTSLSSVYASQHRHICDTNLELLPLMALVYAVLYLSSDDVAQGHPPVISTGVTHLQQQWLVSLIYSYNFPQN